MAHVPTAGDWNGERRMVASFNGDAFIDISGGVKRCIKTLNPDFALLNMFVFASMSAFGLATATIFPSCPR
jgi:hypothetical protein